MKIISTVNYKGGVGKTTFIINIAAQLAKEGKSILLIDLDPQGSLTFSLMKVEEWQERYSEKKTIKNWFDDILNNRNTKIEEYIINDLYINKKFTSKSSISLIASHLGLFDISLEMASKLNGVSERDTAKNKINCLFILKKGLCSMEKKYDYIFIDCQPSFDLLTQNAIIASDYYFIPTKFDYLSTLGIDSLLFHISNMVKEVERYKHKYNFRGYSLKPQLLGVAGNMVTIAKKNNITTFNRNIENNLDNEKYKLFKHSVRNNQEFMDMTDLVPAVLKKADNETRRNIVKEIQGLTSEFEERVNE